MRAEAGDGSWEGDRMAALAVPTPGQTALPGQSKAGFNPSLGCTAGKGESEASLCLSHSPNVSSIPVFPPFPHSVLLMRLYQCTGRLRTHFAQGKLYSRNISTGINPPELPAFSSGNPLGDGWHEESPPPPPSLRSLGAKGGSAGSQTF